MVLLGVAETKAPTVVQPMLVGAEVPQPVRDIIERSCRDCHSLNTHWPWYSRLPVLKGLLEKDVADARKFMDLSSWEQYPRGRKMGYLAGIGITALKGRMPPTRYVMLHPGADLSTSERQQLSTWARSELLRLKNSPRK